MMKGQTCSTELAEAMTKPCLHTSKILNARDICQWSYQKQYSSSTSMSMLLETIYFLVMKDNILRNCYQQPAQIQTDQGVTSPR